MSRGRKRAHNPHIPAHIDQRLIPPGVYYDHRHGGTWYTRHTEPNGTQSRQNIAGPNAKLSDLHRLAEEDISTDRGSLAWLCKQYHQSNQFKTLAPATQKNYEYCQQAILSQPTKLKKPLGQLDAQKFTAALVQRLIDQIAENHPSKAAHILRYLRRVFRWGSLRGYCSVAPVTGLDAPKERKQRRLPTEDTYDRLLNLAKERGQYTRGTKGACASYLWMIMEIAYLCRLRGIEADTLTDANNTPDGVLSNRRKGSRDNITAWSPRLSAAWTAAVARRTLIWQKQRCPIPIKPENRPLIVSSQGQALAKSSLDSAWQRFILMAISEEVISADERFGLHDLKRKGITDTNGTRADKQHASGHRSEAMMDIYDLSVPIVQPAKNN